MSKELLTCLVALTLLASCYEGIPVQDPNSVQLQGEVSVEELQRRLDDYEEAYDMQQAALDVITDEMSELERVEAPRSERDALQRRSVEAQAELRRLEEGIFDLEDALAERNRQ